MKRRVTITCFLMLFSLMFFSFYSTEITQGKVSTIIETVENEIDAELTIADLDWVACDIIKDSILTEFDPLSSGGYSLDQTPSSIHLLETTGIYDRYYGAYTTFPTTTGVFSINFEVKVKAGFPEAVNLAMSVYDNQTKLINKHIGLVGRGEAIYVTDSLETPYFSSNSTFVMEGVTEVLIFFFFSDSWVADWDQECWIQNLVITTNIDESSLLSERSTEIISSPGPNLSGLLWKDSKIFCGVGVRNISDIVEMNPLTEEVIAEHRATRKHDITFDGTNFWGSASSPTVDWIQKYDSSFSTVENLYLAFTDTSGVAFDGSNLWVGNHVTDMIYKINPTSGSTLASIPGPGTRTRGLHYSGDYLWVVDSEAQQFYKLSPTDGDIIETYDSAFPDPVSITVDDDGYIWLSSHSCNIIFKTNVNANSDAISPLITSSSDLVYELGSSNNYISWVLEDWNPNTYEIYRDGIKQIGPIIWTDGQNITINVDLLPIGTYNYTIIAKDLQGNEASNTIWVTVLEEIGPIITSSGNLEYLVGTTNNYVSWLIVGEDADTHEIYRDGIKQIGPIIWTDGQNITINVDLLPVGIYNYTLVATDTYDNEAMSTIFVTVVEVDSSPPTITPSSNLEYQLGNTGNFISWKLEDANPDTYEIYRDGLLITSATSWTDGQNISVNVDLLTVGTYNYTLVAKDEYEHEASNTIWVTVTVLEKTSYGWISIVPFIVLIISIPVIRKRRRK